MNKTEAIFVVLGVGLCAVIMGTAIYFNYFYSIEGVWVVQPFFAYNLTHGDGGPDYTVEGQQVLRIFPVGDGRRFNLYGSVDYSIVSEDPHPIENTTQCVIEGTRTYRYSRSDLEVWIKVERMYDYTLCLDENGYLDQLPYKGELPQ